jgi:hypothetical protein
VVEGQASSSLSGRLTHRAARTRIKRQRPAICGC